MGLVGPAVRVVHVDLAVANKDNRNKRWRPVAGVVPGTGLQIRYIREGYRVRFSQVAAINS